MKRFLSLALSVAVLQAAAAFGAVVQDWTNVGQGMAGTYQDSNGSKIEFAFDAGPSGSKALKLTTTLASGGYAGVYTSGTFDLSKYGVLTFMAKTTVPGDVQIAIKDAFNVQYIGKVAISSTDWAPATLTLSSLSKDPYYTPPDAITGHPMDLSKVGNLNFSPQIQGSSVVLIGPVSGSGTPSASAASSSSSSSTTAAVVVPSGSGVQILDAGTLDSKSAGTFQDSQGSSFTFTSKDNPSKKGSKYLAITYELKQGGYAGMWARAGGSDWNGVNLKDKKVVSLTIYSKDPVSLGLAIKDATNNQYVADTPMTKGGKWETVVINLSDFKLDPYYTPPDAKKGAPQDLSKVAGFNIQAKTVGKFTVAVDNVVAK
jgi:hypothetical protein